MLWPQKWYKDVQFVLAIPTIFCALLAKTVTEVIKMQRSFLVDDRVLVFTEAALE